MAGRGRPRKNPIVTGPVKPKRKPRRASPSGGLVPYHPGYEPDDEIIELRKQAEKVHLRRQIEGDWSDQIPGVMKTGGECAKVATAPSHSDHLANHDESLATLYNDLLDLRIRLDKLESKVG